MSGILHGRRDLSAVAFSEGGSAAPFMVNHHGEPQCNCKSPAALRPPGLVLDVPLDG